MPFGTYRPSTNFRAGLDIMCWPDGLFLVHKGQASVSLAVVIEWRE
jgi:hypothetical protein